MPESAWALEKLGDIEFSGKDIAAPPAKVDRIAIDRGNRVLLVSVVAETQSLKAMRAILNGGAKASIQASGGKVVNSETGRSKSIGGGSYLRAADQGYESHVHKLDYGLAHCMFLARSPGFMPVVNNDSLWRELSSIRFTTPILRDWLPYIEKMLRASDYLRTTDNFNCECGELIANTAQLDRIVTLGIRDGSIVIPEKSRLDFS